MVKFGQRWLRVEESGWGYLTLLILLPMAQSAAGAQSTG